MTANNSLSPAPSSFSLPPLASPSASKGFADCDEEGGLEEESFGGIPGGSLARFSPAM